MEVSEQTAVINNNSYNTPGTDCTIVSAFGSWTTFFNFQVGEALLLEFGAYYYPLSLVPIFRGLCAHVACEARLLTNLDIGRSIGVLLDFN
jgi:hypothetical protein